jgi:hypothetical protein
MILVNTGGAALCTAAACSVWQVLSIFTELSTYPRDSRALIATLGILALSNLLHPLFLPRLYSA